MKRKGLILTMCLVNMFKMSLGQVTPDNLILTKAQSDNWVSRLEAAPIAAQLDLMKNRVLLDTNVYVRSSDPDRIRLQDESENGKRIEAYSRPFIVINGQCKHYHAAINNKTKNQSIGQLAELQTEENIKLMTVHKDNNATAIYGSRANGGVIILSTKNRKTCKKFDRNRLGLI